MSTLTTSGATVAANNGGADGSPGESSLPEVDRLREELQQCQEKFATWKEKAKTGVDNLRAQIIELNAGLERSEQKRAAELRTSSRAQSSISAQADILSAHSFMVACLFADSITLQYRSTGNVANSTSSVASAASAAATLAPASFPSQDAIVKKLQRTIQEQSDRLKETQHALKRSANEARQRLEALERQDELMATLKRRVEALEAAKISLEEQLMNVPNADEWRAAQDELDRQLERSRLEYEKRESDLVLQHNNEIQALNAAHEQDMRELQRDAQEKLTEAVEIALASQGQTVNSASAQPSQKEHHKSEDAAYIELLSDYKALEATSATAAKERDAALNQQKTLLRELQGLFSAIGAGGIASASHTPQSSAGNAVIANEMTVEDAIRQIGEQRVRLVTLHEDLGHCRREVLQLKRSKPSVPPDGLGAQQTQYLRSVVVQVLCSLNDTSVVKRLLPVLSTLLKFSDDDLKVVTKAMPQWTHRR